MIWIDLPLSKFATGERSAVVKAGLVDIAPHLASVATFAVHRNVMDRSRYISNGVQS